MLQGSLNYKENWYKFYTGWVHSYSPSIFLWPRLYCLPFYDPNNSLVMQRHLVRYAHIMSIHVSSPDSWFLSFAPFTFGGTILADAARTSEVCVSHQTMEVPGMLFSNLVRSLVHLKNHVQSLHSRDHHCAPGKLKEFKRNSSEIFDFSVISS